jgi:hypothetical protein
MKKLYLIVAIVCIILASIVLLIVSSRKSAPVTRNGETVNVQSEAGDRETGLYTNTRYGISFPHPENTEVLEYHYKRSSSVRDTVVLQETNRGEERILVINFYDHDPVAEIQHRGETIFETENYIFRKLDTSQNPENKQALVRKVKDQYMVILPLKYNPEELSAFLNSLIIEE